MTEDQKRQVIAALTRKGAVKPCPRCGLEDFELVDRVSIPLEGGSPRYKRGGLMSTFSQVSLPCVLVGCSNCGCTFTHSLVLLGFPTDFGEQ